MACCCKPGQSKVASSCLGRCDLPKHKCLARSEVKPPPIPSYMGWDYTAKDAPEHQLRCGWRPGHIACPVLRRIEQHNCMKACGSCCSQPPCAKPCCGTPCIAVCPSTPSCGPAPCGPSPCKPPPCGQPIIRIIRHAGQYSICTKPSEISNAPAGPFPLKYVLNTDENDGADDKAKFSVEAKFNDYHFDYTTSQSSFVLDFSPPESCCKPCPKKSVLCMLCNTSNTWPLKLRRSKSEVVPTSKQSSLCSSTKFE